MREAELQARPLGDGWVEVRLVYQTKPGDQRQPHHARGSNANRDIAHFIISFAASIAGTAGASYLAQALAQLWEHIHAQSGCTCSQTRH